MFQSKLQLACAKTRESRVTRDSTVSKTENIVFKIDVVVAVRSNRIECLESVWAAEDIPDKCRARQGHLIKNGQDDANRS